MKKIVFQLFIFALIIFSRNIFAANNAITLATEATYPPFEFLDKTGTMQGFDIDIVKALCQKMQTQCTFSNQAFDSLIPSLQLGKFDAIFGAINITDERQKQVDFTQPYYVNTASLVALKSKNLTLAPESLKGKTIGVQSGTTMQSYVKEKYGDAVKVNTYASDQSAFLDLTSGRIDAVMGDTPLIMQWLKQHTDQYQIVGQPIHDEKYFGKGYGIAVKKGNKALLAELNKAIVAIKADGSYEKIVQQHFGTK